MAYKATHRFARISARKVRPLADLIRGKHADEALDILRYMPQRGARLLEKVIKSALGNAEDKRELERQRPDRERLPHRRRADVQAHPADVARHGVCDPQADGPHFASNWNNENKLAAELDIRRSRNSWVKKSIRSVFASASWRAGKAAGMPPSRNSAT